MAGRTSKKRLSREQQALRSAVELHSSDAIIESWASIESNCDAVKDSYRSMAVVKYYFGVFRGTPAAREALNLQLADAGWLIGQ